MKNLVKCFWGKKRMFLWVWMLYASCFYCVESFAQEHSIDMASSPSDKMVDVDEDSNIQVRINGIQEEHCLRDGDVVDLSLSDMNSNMHIDSVKWKVCLKTFNGEDIYRHLSDEDRYSFTVEPEIFGCYFRKMADEKETYFYGGSSWPDGRGSG